MSHIKSDDAYCLKFNRSQGFFSNSSRNDYNFRELSTSLWDYSRRNRPQYETDKYNDIKVTHTHAYALSRAF